MRPLKTAPVVRSLKGDRAFQRLRKGRPGGSKLLSVRLRSARHGEARVAFVVSKKVGKAVVRNRVRRRLREGLRATLSAGLPAAWPESFDLLVMVRPEAAEADYATLRDALLRAVDRAVAS